ncbi:Pex19-domain-containing protein [Trametes coccinea BRFM310]|uniref:Pex19-domain-containing protein n=1 Tax=Trametes coccinea (strain BRFM310) TaxID=1353009 RepID=A0A1Y2IEV6_TRAC3|nr:Pex19-domain-containing protein [Trametes coccinea BRFM310]
MAAPRKTTVEEDDLDDLDDVLEQFNKPAPKAAASTAGVSSSTSQTPSKSAPPAQAPASEKKPDPFGLDGIDDDFARELTKGMESLFRDIAQGAGLDDIPDLSKAEEGTTDEEREKAFKAAWEAMLVEGMNGAMAPEDIVAGKGKAATTAGASGSGSGAADASTDSFQDNIKKMMEKLKESDRKADEATSKGEGLEDIFSRLSGDIDATESEDELKGLLENMMSQLMSKEVLYEPLKELHDKFPSYLEDNASKLSEEDKKRYSSQSKIVAEIVATFEDPSYSDDDPQKGLKVVELMQEMQEHGSPPAEIMGPLPPGFDLGPDGLPSLPEGCTIA